MNTLGRIGCVAIICVAASCSKESGFSLEELAGCYADDRGTLVFRLTDRGEVHRPDGDKLSTIRKKPRSAGVAMSSPALKFDIQSKSVVIEQGQEQMHLVVGLFGRFSFEMKERRSGAPLAFFQTECPNQ